MYHRTSSGGSKKLTCQGIQLKVESQTLLGSLLRAHALSVWEKALLFFELMAFPNDESGGNPDSLEKSSVPNCGNVSQCLYFLTY